MSLAHLDQIIELERGEARELCWQVGDVLRRVAVGSALEPPKRIKADLFLALSVLKRVAGRLYGVAQREAATTGPPGRRPRRFRLRAEEVVAIMRYVHPVASGAWVELGKVQRVALNLERWILFT